MNTRFAAHNIQQKDAEHFAELDPMLCKLKGLKYVRTFSPFAELPLDQVGFFTLTGGGQTGKTTLIKQWIAKFIADGREGATITFLPAGEIKNYRELTQLLQTQLTAKQSHQIVFIDDVTDVRDWEKAIKFIVENGYLKQAFIVLTSSDISLSQTITTLFPDQNKIDFHLTSLTFHEVVSLKYPHGSINEINLAEEFNSYLMHGGYLPAINDFAMQGEILDNTLKTYSDWLVKKILQQGKNEHFLREILTVINKHYNEQISWNMLSQEVTINHPKTIGDYIALLEALDVMFVQYALLEKELSAAPKKARKVIYTDPFIFHAINAWINPGKNIFINQIQPMISNLETSAKLVKSSVTIHYRNHYPTYYIKAEGEVDLAYVYQNRFWPLVVAWTFELHTKSLKQILKYSNGKILTRTERSGIIEHIRTEPLPQALWRLDE